MLISKTDHFTVAAAFYLNERAKWYRRQLRLEDGSDSTNHTPRHML